MADKIPGSISFNFVSGSSMTRVFDDLDEAIDDIFNAADGSGLLYVGGGVTINLNNVTTFSFGKERS